MRSTNLPKPARTSILLLIVAMLGLTLGDESSPQVVTAQSPPSGGSYGLLASQVFDLHAGWNAIWLDVAPEVDCEDPEASLTCEPEQLFAELLAAGRLESVWAWEPDVTPSFVSDPAETLIPGEDWLVFFPPSGPHAEISDLFTLFSHRPYLVELSDGPSLTLEVVGRPAVRQVEWVANSFNLVGFPIDPAVEPTFDDFFAASEAHAGQEIYRLAADSSWQMVDRATERMRYGEAYWVYSAGPSEFSAPLELELDLGDKELDFDEAFLLESLRVRPLKPLPEDPEADPLPAEAVTVTMRMQPADAPVPLSYPEVLTPDDSPDVEEGQVDFVWIDLPADHEMVLPEDQSGWLELAVRRDDFAADASGSILHIHDGRGSRWRVPVLARRPAVDPTPTPGLLDRVSRRLGFDQQDDFELPPGLWVGDVTVDRVSVVHPTPVGVNDPPATPAPVCTNGVDPDDPAVCADGQDGSTFDFRLILHADEPAEGEAQGYHLLTEVIAMREKAYDANGDPVLVLVARDALIGDYEALDERDGRKFSRRISTAAFDFADPLPGLADAAARRLSFDVTIDAESPTNPFRHRYHPEHDDLDAQYEALPAGLPEHLREVYQVERRLSITFDPPCDLATPEPQGESLSCLMEGNDRERRGYFEERIESLHASPIHVSGRFELTRVSDITQLEY